MSDHLSPARPFPGLGWRHADESYCKSSTDYIGAPTHVYLRGSLRVLTSAEQAEYRGLICAHNHVSVSVQGARRAGDDEMHVVRHHFDMIDAEEDNHSPGRIRNLFLPLHLPRGTVGICDCKSDETVVTEPDGFQWSKVNAVTTMHEYGLASTGYPPPRGPIPEDACPHCKHSLAAVERGRCTQSVCGCLVHVQDSVQGNAVVFNPFALEDDCDAFD